MDCSNRHVQRSYAADTRALLERALAHHQNGLIEEAERSYEHVLRREPDHFDALHMLGVLALQTGRPDRAVELITRALSQRPTVAAAHNHLAKALADLARFEDAIACYSVAIELRPSFVDAYLGRATALRHVGRLGEALADCDGAIALRPDVGQAHICRAVTLRFMERAEEALESCYQALVTQPELPDAWDKVGSALRDVGQLDEAIAVLGTAIREWPDFASACMNAGMTHLLLGRPDPGWSLYDRRLSPAGPVIGRILPGSRWSGEQEIAGRTLLVWSEQGLGDTIQFCRFARILESRGAKVILSVQHNLRALLRTLGSAIQVVDDGSEPPAYDWHSPLLSLPLALTMGSETMASAVPYLSAEPERVQRWRERLGGEGFRIGICWQGSRLPIDVGRSFPLALFREISQIPNVRLISLQKGHGTEQLHSTPDGLTVRTLGEDCDAGPDAFLDTAAVMETLDLIITSDTSIAHLAGALGRPTWVALKHVPDWRWQLDRNDSPWYPTHQLFRQQRSRDWEGVFDRMHAELVRLVAGP
jgi:tetratricopeptide (TPR) repeat protein